MNEIAKDADPVSRHMRLTVGGQFNGVDRACLKLEASKNSAELSANWQGFLEAVGCPDVLERGALHYAAQHFQVIMINPRSFEVGQHKDAARAISEAFKALVKEDPRVSGVLSYLLERTSFDKVQKLIADILQKGKSDSI